MITELENMCYDLDFDATIAKELLLKVDINQEFVNNKYGFNSTLLSLAVSFTNVAFVKLLLEYGADPNLIYNDGSDAVLWNLQYSENDDKKDAVMLEITELLLQNGANPHIVIEGEDLLSYATITNIELYDGGTQSIYRKNFIQLLEKYDDRL